LDQVDQTKDVALARHVATVHKTLRAPTREDVKVIEAEVMRAFIVKAQEYEPIIP
jgi:DNA replicative helicase MCM subunit Mcm2 (Cdc46/Mcm family)